MIRADMAEQFFAPGSVIWRVHREMLLLIAGGRSLLMQIAHAKIAAGVAGHSRFQQDPLARLQRTMSTMWSVVFDDAEQARESLRRVRAIHEKVRGTFGVGGEERASYSALDPGLLLWVHATLVDSALLAYERFVGPLSAADKIQYYEETKKLATLFDVPDAEIPPSFDDFRAYIDQMVGGGEIVVTATARALSRDILFPRVWFFRPARPLFTLVTVGLLPEKLRAAYDLSWDGRSEKRLRRFARLTRCLLPWVSPALRFAPQARAALKTTRRAPKKWAKNSALPAKNLD